MKRPILLAALLATSSVMIQPAQSQTTSMLEMFDISTPSAGKINFTGTGTANFNQSIGTNNNFNVGSSTALGVNASASSTEDYTATGDADLQLAGTSRLQQTIGTATSAFNVATASEASSTAAHTSAFEVANSSSYGSSWTADYSDSLKTSGGWEFRDTNNAGATEGAGWYTDNPAEGESGYIASTSATQAQAWEDYSKEEWQAGWKATYDEQYETSYETAVSASSTESVNTDRSGIISGVFSTVDYGSATSEVDAAATTSMEEAATAAASEQITLSGGTYAVAEGGDYAGQSLTQDEMKEIYDKEFTQSFNAAYSSAAGLMRTSDSSVKVTGIGVIADVNASENSSFKANATLIPTAARDGNGNGNASSGANLATSSYANQSNSSTASAFMQAFSGGLPDPQGVTTIEKVNPIYETAGDDSTPVVGYDIVTSVVTTTTSDPVSYDVDLATGELTAQ